MKKSFALDFSCLQQCSLCNLPLFFASSFSAAFHHRFYLEQCINWNFLQWNIIWFQFPEKFFSSRKFDTNCWHFWCYFWWRSISIENDCSLNIKSKHRIQLDEWVLTWKHSFRLRNITQNLETFNKFKVHYSVSNLCF